METRAISKVGIRFVYKRRVVTVEEAIKFKEDNNIQYYSETTTNYGDSCRKVFVEAAKSLHKNYTEYRRRNTVKTADSLIKSNYYPYEDNTGISVRKSNTKEDQLDRSKNKSNSCQNC